VQIIVRPEAEYSPGTYTDGIFIALCDDGTIWERTYEYDRQGSAPPTIRYEWNLIDGPERKG
jgi:hypothetical protein